MTEPELERDPDEEYWEGVFEEESTHGWIARQCSYKSNLGKT